ncbi:I17RC protein, partial [Formicarius rufipectus]|nr:I17RC protein [Formicarius rufipectus]
HPSPGATTDAKAWERLWAQSRLVLHTEGQVLTCSLSAPCDLPAKLVPCWQPVPSGPCQPLPGVQQPAVGQGPQEFGRLRPHPNICVQSSLGGTLPGLLLQPLQPPRASPGVLPGHPDDLLLLERGGNASLCAMEWDVCTPLSTFTRTGTGYPGLLEQDLQRDVVAGQCWQIWHPENSTGIMLWACPMHKYLRARWALVWMGVLLGAACLLLLLLLKKENVKGEQCNPGGCSWPRTCLRTPPHLPLLFTEWLKSLRAGYGSEGE